MSEFPMPRSSLKLKPSTGLTDEILENNNLRKISIPTEGKNNLFKALSFALFMSITEETFIQNKLISQLKTLIQEKRLPLKLAMFENDLMLFKDYCSNSHFHGFDKFSLELASHSFEVRIVVYSISNENYLNSTIYNNRFEKTVSLLKTGSHFDVAVDKAAFEILSFAQNLVYEFLLGVLGIERNTNKAYFIAALETQYDKNESLIENHDGSPPTENRLKPKHKKSRSDNFTVNNDKGEDKSAYYGLFLNLQAPKDFLTSITPSNSSRFAKNFNSEQTKEEPGFRFPTYHTALKMNPKPFTPFNMMKPSESEKDLRAPFGQTPPNNPAMYFMGTTPPGLTPKKLAQAPIGAPKMGLDEEQFQFQIPENKNMKGLKNEDEFGMFQNKGQFGLPDTVL